MTVKVKSKPESSQAEEAALGHPLKGKRGIHHPERLKTLTKQNKKRMWRDNWLVKHALFFTKRRIR